MNELNECERVPKCRTQARLEETGRPRFVICRGYYCGVHAGYLKGYDGNCAVLAKSRRLWSWKAVRGISLSEAAKYGIVGGQSKITAALDEIWLGDVYEIIPCSEAAAASIINAPDYNP